MFGLSNNAMQTIAKVLANYSNIEEVIIFGSRAMGNYKNGSDVDIALKGKIDIAVALEISSVLNEKTTLPYYFDVVSYDSIKNPQLKAHIDRCGKRFQY